MAAGKTESVTTRSAVASALAFESPGEAEHVVGVRVRWAGRNEGRPREKEFGRALVAEILFLGAPRVENGAT